MTNNMVDGSKCSGGKQSRKREVRNSKQEVRIILLNMALGESLTKMTFQQTRKGDVDEPHGFLRCTLRTERTASAKALGKEQTTHLCGSY